MTEEKRKTVLELDMINLCNKLSEPSRSYLLDCYVQLNREDFFRVYIAYMTGYVNGRIEVTEKWRESHNRMKEILLK
jgi:hypothetical protein